MKPHKHAELIKAWADGAEIQYRYKCEREPWYDVYHPDWSRQEVEYRIKPESKPDVVVLISCHGNNLPLFHRVLTPESANLKLTFDGETGELKSAEVLK